MKRLLLLVVCVLFAAAGLGAATRPPPKLLIQVELPPTLGLADPKSTVAQLEDLFLRRINTEFPCTNITTRHAVLAKLDGLRHLAWYGTATDDNPDYQKDLAELGDLMNADYLVRFQVTPLAGQWVLNARWLDTRKAKAIAIRMDTCAAEAGALVNGAEKLADKLIDDAAYFEICGYTGPVKITVHTSRPNRSEREERPTACNGQEQWYVKTTSAEHTSDTALDLTRTDRIWATGSVEYFAVETEDVEEVDPCHLCPSGTKGPRIFTEHKRTEIRITGFSETSGTKSLRLVDVRLYLKFERNGEFRLELESTTKLGTKHVKVDRKAEGVCDTQLKNPRENTTVPFDVPLAHIFGPFRGTPRDKHLEAKQDFRTIDPVTKEETTISVELRLQRP